MAEQVKSFPEAEVAGIEDQKTTAVDVDHQLEHALTVKLVLKHHPALVWWCFFWAMAGVGWGFDAQINGAVLSVASFRRDYGYMLNSEAVLPADWQVAFNTCSSIGQFFGGFLYSYVADRIGRKNSMYIGVLIVTGGILGEIFSRANAAFVVSKLILGFGLGFYLTLGPLCTSEIAPVVLRGMATAGVNLGVTLGQLLSNAVTKALGEREDRWAYAGPFATQLFFCLFLGALRPLAPETPWYLDRNGRRDEAMRSIRKLEEISSSSEQGSIVKCFKGTDRVRTMISTGVFFCQHFVGIVFVLGYSTYFFQLAGLPTACSFDLAVGVTACGVVGNICSWFVVNSFGRRKIFLSGMVTLTSLLLLIGIMDLVPTSAAQWVQAALTVIWAFCYFATIGAMAFAILGEASSTALRAPTMALAVNLIVPYMVNLDQGNLQGKVGFVFGGLGVLATVWAWFYVPELKGRTFDEIDTMFQARVPPHKMGSYVLHGV
ncbi:uncharacterized protein J7T54_008441 [Emericellopsis cladophorae]|uniref:Major facilitator superfamily (MFS) profile domain-containing protein n=1 Tax=Emericellopsis cladophorae TaxID=2686198 RepID=A0A9P9Y3D9_9HYPO|nr:uncharacterized protein J7T54_008441 [Emericellopsis cladophorae]KAI6782355.1 hypothetical protein J7T54_008441 [Emericellopsis cladophorae]